MMQAASIDPREFRSAVGHYASGITIVAGIHDSVPVGFTCQSFYSVSLDPPLVSFSVMKSSTSWPLIRAASKFSVSFLCSEQQSISNAFARQGVDRWAGIKWKWTGNGNPAIQDALAWIDCSLRNQYEAGDHDIIVGEVIEISPIAHSDTRVPLVYFRGRYCRVHELPPHHV